MALFVLAVIIAVPIVEIYVFASVGGEIGPFATVGATILTAAAGVALFRRQGRRVAERVQEAMNRGEMPVAEAVDGLGLALAGLLLLIPGFVTDAIGFLLFVPPLRLIVIGSLLRGVLRSSSTMVFMRRRSGDAGPDGRRGPVIDGDFEDVTTDDDPRRDNEPGKEHNRMIDHDDDGTGPETRR